MESRMTDMSLLTVLLVLLAAVCSTGSEENDKDFEFCGIWHHGTENPLSIDYDLSPGCGDITVSANESSLSLKGQITAQCRQSGPPIPLGQGEHAQIKFCVYWEPLLDQLRVTVAGINYTLCKPSGLQTSCCTDLSQGPKKPEGAYGIANGTIRGDQVTSKTFTAYNFFGGVINCKEEFCEKASQETHNINSIEETVMRSQAVGNVALPCALITVAPDGVAPESTLSVYLPPSLKPANRKTAKVVCTFFRNSSMFQETHSRKCVSWDTRRDLLVIRWKGDGCVTVDKGAKDTECQCNHLTYFTILVELEPRPVRHLLALTVITYLGNAVSAISCVALIIFLCNKRSLTWMAIEVFHTFWLVYMVFSPSPKQYIWNLTGYGLPALPVIILLCVGNIYGVRKVVPSDDVSNPYLMCWMKSTPEALLAHYLTTVSLLGLQVSLGLVMLFLVYRKIRTRDEWRHNSMAFFSIWGLSCLFGTTWSLGFLSYGPLTDFFLFLSCVLNSFQGFFLMLRFYVLGWVKRRAGDSPLEGSSGSTRQQMLQTQEKH
ncbi:hypothetical protein NHX12_005870 [Muraenolepis orangiensis]|uniref:Uncharacterized protein n=1 Tax=Muraenolepis orangiensis TaxID=630683 RepID=A0A9Q0DTP4_9TELE|nr:hypothetical protein NHX12_005870 [Muraenolepis orangiensis]